MSDIYQQIKITHRAKLHANLRPAKLIEEALRRNEGVLSPTGALTVKTGKYTGRSPNDKFVVAYPELQDEIWWENNQPITPERFDALLKKAVVHAQDRDLFVFEGFAGADSTHRLPVRVITEYAWQNLFIHQLLIRQYDSGWKFPDAAGFTILSLPFLTADPNVDGTKSEAFILVNFVKKIILIGGTHYAGEIKKSVFTIMNYLLPKKGVLSMHCAANKNHHDQTSLFFGLSGTGKTTLSADPDLILIGDDEHGWTNDGIFNIEGGCYAKCINLSEENEPQIWSAIKFGAVLENVILDDEIRIPDYSSELLTENTRAGYPVTYIPNCVYPGIGGHPKTIVFLTADAFGVLPPISKLTPEQAMYYFLSGFTSKLAGTERGITEPQATFSACFGQPFLPLRPQVYAELLRQKITQHNVNVFLVNTGWQGGQYGVGKRISLKITRSLVEAAVEGALDNVEYNEHPIFKLQMPATCPHVEAPVLNPENSWADKSAYRAAAEKLQSMFESNYQKKYQ